MTIFFAIKRSPVIYNMSRGKWAQNEVYYEILDSKLTLTYVLTVINNSRDRAIQIASSSVSLFAVIQRTTVGLLWFVTGVNRASCCGRSPRVSVFVSATSPTCLRYDDEADRLGRDPYWEGGKNMVNRVHVSTSTDIRQPHRLPKSKLMRVQCSYESV